MERIAEWIWNPLLSLVYLEIGLLFLVVTAAFAWRHAGRVLAGGFRSTAETGPVGTRSISHREAFFSALAVSVGVGNLAGVATAIHLGGPGALFWMWMSALVGMTYRMCSTYLAIKYRPEPDSPLFGTPMAYLTRFLGSGPWRVIPTLFAALVMIKGLVTANLIQSNSVAHAIQEDVGLSHGIVALLLSGAVALVVVGGLRQILRVSVVIAPWMLGGYILISLVLLISEPYQTVDALLLVFQYAFQPYALAGGVAGYTVLQSIQFGISRGVFSHNSGMGVAPFLHAANTDHPAKGAMLAALVPLFDTILICTLTGLVILSSGHWLEYNGAFLTVSAFERVLGAGGRYAVSACLVVFAFTTMINWAYFSERCFEFLGGRNLLAFRWIFVGVTFIGPFFPVKSLWSLADVLIGLMLILHLLPLTYIVLSRVPTMMRDLAHIPPDPQG
ncbi:MAG: sodium:alanine symporter family protein [Magnetococcales bacterium]|nr:sodium:alanine symporter family protein [Magnetococcales bacterium]